MTGTPYNLAHCGRIKVWSPALLIMTEKIISSSSLREYVNVEYMGDFVYIGNEEGMDRLWIFTINDGLVRNEIHLNDNTLGNLIELFSKRK